jgi:hypothetical protein
VNTGTAGVLLVVQSEGAAAESPGYNVSMNGIAPVSFVSASFGHGLLHVIGVAAILLVILSVSAGSSLWLYWRQRGEAVREAEARDRSHHESWLKPKRRSDGS